LARNIELKTRLVDREGVEAALVLLGAEKQWIRGQKDTFYAVPSGWLKLREADGAAPELISYQRSTHHDGPRPSDYEVRQLDDAMSWHRLLGHVLPVRGIVEKERTLWLWRHTRVHLDYVKGLGEHLELETVLDEIDEDNGRIENAAVIEALQLHDVERLSVPYLEILEARSKS
jgi:adenylate cyclase class IV